MKVSPIISILSARSRMKFLSSDRLPLRKVLCAACIAVLASCGGREGPAGQSAGAAEPFTIVVLPDTQFYTAAMNGGAPEMFIAQTEWIAENRSAQHISFVSHLGDCVQNGDEFEEEWKAADAAMSLLEEAGTTGLAEGIPFGMAVGNHDQSPEGDADGTTTLYNRYFGADRFEGRTYYGGHFADLNDNHFQFFSAGGMDFIVIHLEYDETPDESVLEWADYLLKANADRRAILVTHYLIGAGDAAAFSGQGAAIYEALKDNANLFLMLGGHVGSDGGEGRREDTFEGRTVYSLLADYQSRENGGNGLMRLLRFVPAENEIRIRTFTPIGGLGEGVYERDADSEFVLAYDMQPADI